MLPYVRIHLMCSYAPNEIHRSETNTVCMQHCQLKETLLPSTDTFTFHSSTKQNIITETFVGRDVMQSCAEVPTFRGNLKPILRMEAAGFSRAMVYVYQTILRHILISTLEART
jgi:hypothetical protein